MLFQCKANFHSLGSAVGKWIVGSYGKQVHKTSNCRDDVLNHLKMDLIRPSFHEEKNYPDVLWLALKAGR